MSKKPTNPLKVTALLVDGRINSVDGIVMLDSILYHAWFLKNAPHVLEGLGDANTEKINRHFGLPIGQSNDNKFYLASMGIYKQLAENIEYWNKRPDFFNSDKLDYLDQNKGIISDSVGKYRAYRMPNIVRTIKDNKIEFYCKGHKDEVNDLLALIPAVGKKPSIGWGIVEKWIVEEIEEDYSLIHHEYGLMRPIPVDYMILNNAEKYMQMEYRVKPPYWKNTGKAKCYIPDIMSVINR